MGILDTLDTDSDYFERPNRRAEPRKCAECGEIFYTLRNRATCGLACSVAHQEARKKRGAKILRPRRPTLPRPPKPPTKTQACRDCGEMYSKPKLSNAARCLPCRVIHGRLKWREQNRRDHYRRQSAFEARLTGNAYAHGRRIAQTLRVGGTYMSPRLAAAWNFYETESDRDALLAGYCENEPVIHFAEDRPGHFAIVKIERTAHE